MRQAMLSLLSCGEQLRLWLFRGTAHQLFAAPSFCGYATAARLEGDDKCVFNSFCAKFYFVEVLASSILAPAEICGFRRPFGASYGPHRLEDTGVVLPLAYASSSAKERRGRASIQQVWQPKPESRSAEALNAVAAGPIQHKQPNAIAATPWPRTSPC